MTSEGDGSGASGSRHGVARQNGAAAEPGTSLDVVYHAFGGRFCDNPRAIYSRLVALGTDHAHTWIADPARQHTFPAGLRTVPHGSAACVATLESADLVVSNDHITLDWRKRPETVYLQTWHGTPLKRIHYDVRWAPPGRLDRLSEDVARWDHLLSPNRVSTERLRRAFGFGGAIHETGYPRNDVLTGAGAGVRRAAVRSALGLAETATVVLYTPTWRDDLVFGDDPVGFSLRLDPVEFAERLGPDHVLLLRLHSMIRGRPAVDETGQVIDVSDHPEVSDLYLAADAMVTDYSSTMFDFAVTGKPIVFYTYDLDHYRDQLRGFYFELADQAPGPMLRTSGEVLAALQNLDVVREEYRTRYARFRQTFCHLDDGHAADRVIDRFLTVSSADRV